MQEYRLLRYTTQVFIIILFMLFFSSLFAGEIQGNVIEAEDKEVHIIGLERQLKILSNFF